MTQNKERFKFVINALCYADLMRDAQRKMNYLRTDAWAFFAGEEGDVKLPV